MFTWIIIILNKRNETCQWLKFPLNGLQAQNKVSPVVELLHLASGLACLWRAFPPNTNRLPRVMKYYSPTGRRNQGRPLKRLLDTWDWNRSTSGPTPWKIYDDDKRNVCQIIFKQWYGTADQLYYYAQCSLYKK